MKIRYVLFGLLGITLLISKARATITTVDQAFLYDYLISGAFYPGENSGQSFTPNLSGLNAFAFELQSGGISTVQVDILQGQTIVGTPIATTGPVQINNTSLSLDEFDFASTVPLVPGTKYTARIDLLSGSYIGEGFSNLDGRGYGGGALIDEYNNAYAGEDLGFEEGFTAIPEPTYRCLTIAALVICVVAAKRQLKVPPIKLPSKCHPFSTQICY